MKKFSIVVAMDEENGIGKAGNLAWRIPADLKHFKDITSKTDDPAKKNAVIMGRITWESLPEKFKPLPGRLNVVLSQNASQLTSPEVLFFTFFDEAIKYLSIKPEIENIHVIGGAQIYTHALEHPQCETLYVTHIKGHYDCDVFFPTIKSSFILKKSSDWAQEGGSTFRFCEYRK